LKNKYFEDAYLFLLIATFGISLFIGIIVAPTIFGSELSFADEVLTKFQEGLLMTTIFVKFNYLLNFVIATIITFEIINYKNGIWDKFTFSAIFIFISTALLFTNYYTPQILELQSLENTEGKIFENLHFASELDFKIFTFALLFLIIRKLKLL